MVGDSGLTGYLLHTPSPLDSGYRPYRVYDEDPPTTLGVEETRPSSVRKTRYSGERSSLNIYFLFYLESHFFFCGPVINRGTRCRNITL